MSDLPGLPKRRSCIAVGQALVTEQVDAAATDLDAQAPDDSRVAAASSASAIVSRHDRWLSDNHVAIKSSNEFVALHGLPLAVHRQF